MTWHDYKLKVIKMGRHYRVIRLNVRTGQIHIFANRFTTLQRAKSYLYRVLTWGKTREFQEKYARLS